MRTAAFVAYAQTKDKCFALLLADAGYPFVVRTSVDPRAVPGELYECDDETLAELDILEEISTGMYTRETIDVEVADSPTPLAAFVYLAGALDNLDALPRIDAYTKALHDRVYLSKAQRTNGVTDSFH